MCSELFTVLVALFAAEKLSIGGSIPGFLDPKLKPGQLVTGVSFASAGSGYDDATAKRSVGRSASSNQILAVGRMHLI